MKLSKFEEVINKLIEITLPKKGGWGLKVAISGKIISQDLNKLKSILFDSDMLKWVLFFYPIIQESKHYIWLKEKSE